MICDVVAVFSSSVVASGALDALGLGQARQTVKIQRKFLTAATQTVRTRAKSRLVRGCFRLQTAASSLWQDVCCRLTGSYAARCIWQP